MDFFKDLGSLTFSRVLETKPAQRLKRQEFEKLAKLNMSFLLFLAFLILVFGFAIGKSNA